MNELLKKRASIYGVCAVWIILFHIFRRISMPYIPVITNIIGVGNSAVDVFFFLSGLSLSLSAKRHQYLQKGWTNYYKRRFTRVLVPYAIVCVPYYLWSAVYEATGGAAKKAAVFIANLSSASFWINGMQTTWYVYGILVFYLLFPWLYSLTCNKQKKHITALVCGMIVFAVAVSYVPILKNSIVVWARLPIFYIGVIFGVKYPKTKKTNSFEVVAAVIVLCALGWLTSLSEISESFTIPQVYRLLMYISMTLSLVLLLSKGNKGLGLFDWIGSLSLESYLVHITLLHPLAYYGVIERVGYWLYLILPIVTMVIAYIVGKIEGLLLRKPGLTE